MADISVYLKALSDLYEYHGAGGVLHIVVDDGSVEDVYLDWCRNEDGWSEKEEAVFKLLRPLSKDMREYIIDTFHSKDTSK